MVLRDLERRPWRLLFSALGISLAVATLIVGRFSNDSVAVVMDRQFDRVQREDLAVSFFDAVDARVLRELALLPGVLAVEGQRDVPVRLVSGPVVREVALTGLPPGGTLRRVLDARGAAGEHRGAGAAPLADPGRTAGRRAGRRSRGPGARGGSPGATGSRPPGDRRTVRTRRLPVPAGAVAAPGAGAALHLGDAAGGSARGARALPRPAGAAARGQHQPRVAGPRALQGPVGPGAAGLHHLPGGLRQRHHHRGRLQQRAHRARGALAGSRDAPGPGLHPAGDRHRAPGGGGRGVRPRPSGGDAARDGCWPGSRSGRASTPSSSGSR